MVVKKKAFPCDSEVPWASGMDLLDWFAGEAVPNLQRTTLDPKKIAVGSYDIAEAMMEERKRR